MKLIVGIGNPGKKYETTRHNAGVLFVKYLKEISGTKDYKLEVSDEFMNSSGVFVREKRDYYNLDLEDLFIAHDDLDLPLGEYKIQQGIGPKVHNGINSINQALGNSNYWRIRIGIDNRDSDNRIPGEAYVLQNFQKLELELLDQTFEKIYKELTK